MIKRYVNRFFCEHQYSDKGFNVVFDAINLTYVETRRCVKCGKKQRFYRKLEVIECQEENADNLEHLDIKVKYKD